GGFLLDSSQTAGSVSELQSLGNPTRMTARRFLPGAPIRLPTTADNTVLPTQPSIPIPFGSHQPQSTAPKLRNSMEFIVRMMRENSAARYSNRQLLHGRWEHSPKPMYKEKESGGRLDHD